MTVTVKTSKKQLKAAARDLQTYVDLKMERDEIMQEAREKCAPIEESIKACEEKLEQFAIEHRSQFDEKNNFYFEGQEAYLKWSEKTVVIQGKEFDIRKFMRSFPDAVKHSVIVSAVKKLLIDADKRKRMQNHDVDLKIEEVFNIVLPKN